MIPGKTSSTGIVCTVVLSMIFWGAGTEMDSRCRIYFRQCPWAEEGGRVA
jgi:hypothetical protein